MKRLMKPVLLAAALSACAFAASAQTAAVDARAQADVSATALDASDPASEPSKSNDAAAPAAVAKKDRNDPTCLTQTGSRLQSRSKDGCVGYGRSYSRKDLDRTGQIDVGEALRRLDPRLY
ncbi:MAG: hypothetical protein ACREP7_21265 [Lysobacter sp.]